MHEQGVVAKAAARMLAQAEGRPVTAVRIAVGPRADRDVVEAAWAGLVAGTPLARAEVRFEDAKDPMVCFDCGAAYEGSALVCCPACGGNGLARELVADVAVEAVER